MPVKACWEYPKFLIFKLPNVSNEDASSIRKRLLRSAINKRNKEFQHALKELVYPKTFYLNSFLLLTFTSLKKLQHRKAINRYRNRYIYSTEKIIFTDEGF